MANPEIAGPRVGIVCGSRSDFPVMEKAVEMLGKLGVPCELHAISAHRAPDLLFRFVGEAEGRGIRVFIAGAGGAAHLPGVVAAKTILPVIGVPIPTQVAGGLDSLLSIVQMPKGIPVATVAIGGAENAALLAAEILALGDPDLRNRLLAFRDAQDPCGAALSLTDLGNIDCIQGNYAGAHAAYREALQIFAGLGHRRGMARTLEGYACLALSRGDASRALTLAAAAARLRQLIGATLTQAEQSELDRMLQPAWTSLGEADGKIAWAQGSAMSLEKVIQYSYSYSLQEPGSAITA